jgi:hypothetical protein
MSSAPDFIAFACNVLPPMSPETFRKAKLNMRLLPQEEEELKEATKRILQASGFRYHGNDIDENISIFRTASSHICDVENSSSEKLLFLSFVALHSEVWQRHSVQSMISALPVNFSTLPELIDSKFRVYSIGDCSSSSRAKAIVGNPCTYSEITHRMGRINHDLRYLQR